MIPVSLRLRNFLSYGEDVPPLDFTGFRLACLSGNNGHGKSSLLDAITWAIWGEGRKVSTARTADEGLLRLGTTEMEVELEFDLEGDRYRILRKFEKKTKTPRSLLDFQIWDQGQDRYLPLSESAKTLTQEKINQTLHMDYETFINSAFILQGRADEFTKKGARQRKEILANILRLSHYDELSDLARKHVRQAKEDWRVLQNTLQAKDLEVARKEEYEQQLAVLDTGIKKLKQELAKQEKELNQNRKEKANLEAQQQQGQTLAKRQQQLSQEQKKTQQQIKEHTEKIALYNHTLEKAGQIKEQHQQYLQAWDKEQELEKLRRQEQQLQETMREIQRQIEQAKHQLNTQLQVLQTKQQRFNQQASQLSALQKEEKLLQEKLAKYRQLEAKKEELKKQGENLKLSISQKGHEQKTLEQRLKECLEKQYLLGHSETAQCPLCQTDLDASKKQQLVEQLGSQSQETQQKIQTLTQELEQEQQQLQKLRQEFKSTQEQMKGIETVQQEVGRLTAAIKDAQAAQKDLAEANNLAQQLQQRLKTADYAQAQQKELANLQEHLKKLGYQAQEHTRLRQQLQQLKDVPRQWEQLHNTQENLNSTQTMLAQLEERQQQLGQQQAELQEQTQDLKDISQRLPQVINQIQQQEATYKTLNQRNEQLMQEQGSYKSKLEHCLKLAREISDLQEQSRQLEFQRSIYEKLSLAFGKDGIQALIIENVIPEIEEEANQILSRLTSNQTQVSIEAVRDKKTGGQQETLDIKISDELGTRSYEMYSGGESFRINFALRIALSKLLARRAGTRLRTLVIDEGFGTQDNEGLEHLIEAIEAISRDFDKIIVVTHLEAIKEAFPVTIKVTKHSDTGSTFEVI